MNDSNPKVGNGFGVFLMPIIYSNRSLKTDFSFPTFSFTIWVSRNEIWQLIDSNGNGKNLSILLAFWLESQ